MCISAIFFRQLPILPYIAGQFSTYIHLCYIDWDRAPPMRTSATSCHSHNIRAPQCHIRHIIASISDVMDASAPHIATAACAISGVCFVGSLDLASLRLTAGDTLAPLSGKARLNYGVVLCHAQSNAKIECDCAVTPLVSPQMKVNGLAPPLPSPQNLSRISCHTTPP